MSASSPPLTPVIGSWPILAGINCFSFLLWTNIWQFFYKLCDSIRTPHKVSKQAMVSTALFRCCIFPAIRRKRFFFKCLFSGDAILSSTFWQECSQCTLQPRRSDIANFSPTAALRPFISASLQSMMIAWQWRDLPRSKSECFSLQWSNIFL